MNTILCKTMKELISAAALNFSRSRLMPPDVNIWNVVKNNPSSIQDMEKDWNMACLLYVNNYFEGNFNLSEFEDECYYEFENIWLDDIKKFRAYHLFLNYPSNTEEQNYYAVCDKLRKDLYEFSPLIEETEEEKFSRIKDFEQVKNYLQKNYSSNSTKRKTIITKKAARIYQTTGDNKNMVLAKDYVNNFYDHIIPAVTKNNSKSISNVFEAFKYKSIINAFEAKIAISYIDKTFIGKKQPVEESTMVL